MKDFNFKVGNMRTEQDFTLYPYDGSDTIHLQSDKRWITANLRTGKGYINNKNKPYARAADLITNPIEITIPETTLKEIQEKLWNNEGKKGELKQGGVTVLTWEVKDLFSKK